MSIYGQITLFVYLFCWYVIELYIYAQVKCVITNILTKSIALATNNKTILFLNFPWPREQSVVPWKLQMWQFLIKVLQ